MFCSVRPYLKVIYWLNRIALLSISESIEHFIWIISALQTYYMFLFMLSDRKGQNLGRTEYNLWNRLFLLQFICRIVKVACAIALIDNLILEKHSSNFLSLLKYRPYLMYEELIETAEAAARGVLISIMDCPHMSRPVRSRPFVEAGAICREVPINKRVCRSEHSPSLSS